MKRLVITNETTRAKAVRVKGGHEIIKPSKSKTLAVDWGKEEITKYRNAGLIIQTPEEVARDAATAKRSAAAVKKATQK